MRIIRDFFGVVFKIEEYVEKKEEQLEEKVEEEIESQSVESDKIKLTPKIMLFKCLGIGLTNLARNTN
jgi:hypothetical protein